MPPEVHPAIAKKIEELLEVAKNLTSAHQQNVDILAKTLDLKDLYGVKMRVAEIVDSAVKLQWVAAKLDALRDIPYEMAASDMAPKRRTSQSLPAVRLEKKDPE